MFEQVQHNPRAVINRIFFEHLQDNKGDDGRIGDLARKVIASGILPEDPKFPYWRDYIDPIPVFASLSNMSVAKYLKWRNRNKS